MIHVATAHHHADEWIEIQRRYLDRHMGEPFRVYGSLQGIDQSYEKFFDVVVPSKGEHAGKLNLMGHVILEQAAPDDLILFLDGDAFPVADVSATVRPLLDHNALVAVQRLENFGDSQPHPCFCVVPARTWRELPGDWSAAHPMREGRTDVGCNLLWLLERRGLPWAPLLRSHAFADHSLLFAIYDDLVYHHGAGFRGLKPPGKDSNEWGGRRPLSTLHRDRMEKMAKNRPDDFERFVGKAMENALKSAEILEQIRDDPDMFERAIRTGEYRVPAPTPT